MKTTLMKMTWWCLASPGAAPTAVGADSRESEPRRQGGMYGTLVEMASTPLERAHRWLTPLKDVPGGKRAAVDRSCGSTNRQASVPGGRKSSGRVAAPRTADLCARESRHPSGLHTGGRQTELVLPASAAEVVAARGRDVGTRGLTVSDRAAASKSSYYVSWNRDCTPSVLTLPIRSGAAFRRTRGDEMAPVGKKPSHAGKAVVAGGISGAVEICCTYPVSRLTCDPMTAPPTPSVPPSTVRTRSLHRLSSPRQCSSCPPRMCLPWRS